MIQQYVRDASTMVFRLDPLLDGSRACIMKRSKLTYHIKTTLKLVRQESFKAHIRKPEGPIRDSLHSGPSKVSSPPADHPPTYRKFLMDKHTKTENTQKIYLSARFTVSKSLIFRNINP